VPFGHGIFYALAAETARQPALQRIAPAITRGVLAAGSLIAIVSLLFFRDQWGLLWWVIAATLLVRSRNQLLLSGCFVFTMLLEWLGTAIGNWQWAGEVPFIGLHSANPPSGVGVLYIALDLITVAICTARRSNLQSAHATADSFVSRPPRLRCGRLHTHHLGCSERQADDGDLPLRGGVPLPDRPAGRTRIQPGRARSR
jgi:hypothetical protein